MEGYGFYLAKRVCDDKFYLFIYLFFFYFASLQLYFESDQIWLFREVTGYMEGTGFI